MFYFDSLIWIIIGVSVLAGIIKLLFWVFLGMGVLKSTQSYQQNIFNQLLGLPVPRPSQEELDSSHRRKYATSGLVIGSIVMLIGVSMIFSGLGSGQIELSYLGMSLNRAGPGTVMCVLGVAIMKFTKQG